MIDATRDPIDIIAPGIQETEMQFFVVRFTKQIADEVMLHNREPEPGRESTNRKASKIRIAEYNAAMDAGEWLVSPQAIVFSAPNDKGETELVDGQQRVKAFLQQCLKEPDFEIDFTVCVNAPVGVKMVLDRGKPRSLVDALQMEGHKNSRVLSPAVKLLYCYEEVPFTTRSQWASVKLTPQSQEAYLEKHLELRYALDQIRAEPSQGMPHVCTVVYYLIRREHGLERANAFQAGVARGLVEGASTMDARWRLREFLSAKSREKYRWEGFEQLAMFLWAANDWLAGWDAFLPSRQLKALLTAHTFPRLLTAREVGNSF